ncbi:MAG TPA: hypothetical protein VJ754_06480 [Anaerolineae bacterium]|nr:hypothetical protein [Anaerolineae bacterium]
MPEFVELMKELGVQEAAQAGQRLSGHKLTEGFKKRVAMAVELLNEAAAGNAIAKIRLHEALSTSDFPLLVGHALDAVLLASYASVPSDWKKYIHVGSPLKDFRAVDRLRCTRGAGILTEMGEHGSLKFDAPGESRYTFAARVFGGARAITWRMLVNDDLDAVKRAPEDLAWQAANTEFFVASSLFVANTTLFAASGGGRPTGGNFSTLAFSTTNLRAALKQYSLFRDDSSVPIMNRPKYLVHPPALRLQVREAINSALITTTGSADQIIPTGNVLQNILEPVENPWIPYIDPTNGDTSWYIFSDPADGWAVDFSFMAGYEAPALFMKAGDRVALSGRAMDGSFDNGGTAYGVQHVLGGSHTNAVGGWRFAYWSNGTGA